MPNCLFCMPELMVTRLPEPVHIAVTDRYFRLRLVAVWVNSQAVAGLVGAGGQAGFRRLSHRSGDEGGDYAGRVLVQAGAGPVLPHGRPGPARRGARRTIRAAPCRPGRLPSPARNSGPSVRSPMARPIARAVRDGDDLTAVAGDHQGAAARARCPGTWCPRRPSCRPAGHCRRVLRRPVIMLVAAR